MKKIPLHLAIITFSLFLSGCSNSEIKNNSDVSDNTFDINEYYQNFMIQNEIIIGFESDVSKEEIHSIIEEISGEIISYMEEGNSYHVRIKNSLEAEKYFSILDQLNDLDAIYAAMPNMVMDNL